MGKSKMKSKVSKGLKKVKGYVSDQKQKMRDFQSKSRFGAPSSASDSESVSTFTPRDESGGSKGVGNPKSGIRIKIIGTSLGGALVSSLAAFIFIPAVNSIASKYLWISFGGSSVSLVLSFLGISASLATIFSLYIITFKLGEVKRKALDGWTVVICVGVSAGLAAMSVFIATLHFHDVIEIFGEEFLELMEGYWINPKFKSTMDRIQIEFHCCGFYSYEDWADFETGGLSKDFVPFSCCSMFTLQPCANDHVPTMDELEARLGDNMGIDDELTIYPNGCKVPMEDYYKSMLSWAIIISAFLLATQAVLFLLLTCSRKPDNYP